MIIIKKSVRLLSITLLLLVLFGYVLSGKELYSETLELKDIVIETYRMPFESFLSTRNISVIHRNEIEELYPVNLNDILTYAGAVDIQTRGPMGIQSDVNIRGGNFEQVLVVVDGIPLRDPQTGHFLMDLPLLPQDIEKIEILKGGGASLYGANAMTGIIHVMTRRPEKREYAVGLQVGENGFAEGALRVQEAKNAWNWSLTASQKESDGYMEDTDFLVRTLNSSLQMAEEDRDLKVFYGYLDKDFGAANFYSNLFPHEEEKTETHLAYIKGRFPLGGSFSATAKAFLRKQDDHFIIDRNRPSFFQNFHTNTNRGVEAFVEKSEAPLKWSAGFALSEDEISSSSLGDHARNHRSLMSEIQWSVGEKTFLLANARWDDYKDFGDEWAASLGISRFVSPKWKWRLSAEKSFRIPSFTELFYFSPANRGNSGLDAERSVSYEGGVEYAARDLFASASLFIRNSKDIIDWVRESEQDAWQAENIKETDFRGVELKTENKFQEQGQEYSIDRLVLFYSYIEASDNETGKLSKYVFQFPEHLFQGKIHVCYPLEIRQSITAVYKERESLESYWIFSTVFSRDFAWDEKKAKVFIRVDNIFDEDYEDINDVQMPGRWVRAGAQIAF